MLLLGGYSPAPKYTQPEAPISADRPTGTAYKKTRTVARVPAAPELKWQEFFTNKRLQKIIGTALNNSRDLRLATLNVKKARALYSVQREELFPAVDAGSKQSVPADISSTGKSVTVEQYGVNLGVASCVIDFFGRIRLHRPDELHRGNHTHGHCCKERHCASGLH